MRLTAVFGVALRHLRKQPVRTFLLLQGTVWGVAVAIGPSAVIAGTREAARTEGAILGADRITVTADPTSARPSDLQVDDLTIVRGALEAAATPPVAVGGLRVVRPLGTDAVGAPARRATRPALLLEATAGTERARGLSPEPGPLCYGRVGSASPGELALTDVNLHLGRILPDRFPFPLQPAPVADALAALETELRAAGHALGADEIAAGFVEIANAHMAQAIQEVSVRRGVDPRDFVLVGFGGAGGQHVCAVARRLGIRSVLLHPHAGLLSAYGIGIAELAWDRQRDAGRVPLAAGGRPPAEVAEALASLEAEGRAALAAEGAAAEAIRSERWLDLRYVGSETPLAVAEPEDGDFAAAFAVEHEARFGYLRPGRALEIVHRAAARAGGRIRGECCGAVRRGRRSRHGSPRPRPLLVPRSRACRDPGLLARGARAGHHARRARTRAGGHRHGRARARLPRGGGGFGGAAAALPGRLRRAGLRGEGGRSGARRPGATRGLRQPLHVDCRADGRGASQYLGLHEHQGAARLLVCGLRRRRRTRRECAAHSGAPGRDGRDGAQRAGGLPAAGTGRRGGDERPLPGRLAPARRDRGDAGLPLRGRVGARLLRGEPRAPRGRRRQDAGLDAGGFAQPGGGGRAAACLPPGPRRAARRGRGARGARRRAVSRAQSGRQPGRPRGDGRRQPRRRAAAAGDGRRAGGGGGRHDDAPAPGGGRREGGPRDRPAPGWRASLRRRARRWHPRLCEPPGARGPHEDRLRGHRPPRWRAI